MAHVGPQRHGRKRIVITMTVSGILPYVDWLVLTHSFSHCNTHKLSQYSVLQQQISEELKF